MESTYKELFSVSDMLFNLSPNLPIRSSWREWIILHFTQIIDTETFQKYAVAILHFFLNLKKEHSLSHKWKKEFKFCFVF